MAEQNPTRLSDVNKLIVHNGVYHADDVLTAAMLRSVNPDLEIVRTRNPQVLDAGLNDPHTIVADVGLGEFDHHQDDVASRENGNKYAACGLVYNAYPELKESLPENVRQAFEQQVLSPIQDHDNGVGKESEPDPITDFCSTSLPTWEESRSLDDAFFDALNTVQNGWQELQQGKSLDSILQDFSERAEDNKERNAEAKEHGEEVTRQAYNDTLTKSVVELPAAGIPWQGVLPNSFAEFVIYETSTHDQVNIQAVPPEPGSFAQKIPLKQDSPEFQRAFGSLMSQYEDANRKPFIHKAGFLAGFPVTDKMSAEQVRDALATAGRELSNLTHERQINQELSQESPEIQEMVHTCMNTFKHEMDTLIPSYKENGKIYAPTLNSCTSLCEAPVCEAMEKYSEEFDHDEAEQEYGGPDGRQFEFCTYYQNGYSPEHRDWEVYFDSPELSPETTGKISYYMTGLANPERENWTKEIYQEWDKEPEPITQIKDAINEVVHTCVDNDKVPEGGLDGVCNALSHEIDPSGDLLIYESYGKAFMRDTDSHIEVDMRLDDEVKEWQQEIAECLSKHQDISKDENVQDVPEEAYEETTDSEDTKSDKDVTDSHEDLDPTDF